MSNTWSTIGRVYERLDNTTDRAAQAGDVAAQAMTRVKALEQQVHDLSIVVVTLVEQLAAANAVTVESFQAALDAALAADRADVESERRRTLDTAENVWDSAGGPVGPK